MGILDAFKKKKEDFNIPQDMGDIDLPPLPEFPGPGESPSQQILRMRASGMQNSDIVGAMRQQGFSSPDIMNHMQAASMADFQPASSMQRGMQPLPPPPPAPSFEREERAEEKSAHIEEVAETIVAEKTKNFSDEIEKLAQWKDEANAAISQLQEQIKALEEKMDGLQKAIFGKVEEYNKNIDDVNAELKAMERVFKDVMPEFTENVKELRDIVDTEKKKGKSSKRR